MDLQVCGAAREVTGACYRLRVGTASFLVDCGMHQGGDKEEALNSAPFPFDPRAIDFLLLTHAHIDHSGLIPRLVREGFSGPIYATSATCDLAEIMLLDSAHIQESEAEWRDRKARRAGQGVEEPLYTQEDARRVPALCKAVEYDRPIDVAPGVAVVFHDAGHILGSAFLELRLEEPGQKAMVLFSGDVGQPDQPIIRDPEIVDKTDYLIMESTYGDRLHPREDVGARLTSIVERTASHGGTVVIPSFAVGRTQELLFLFRELIEEKKLHSLPIDVDSPMAIDVTHLYEKHQEDHTLELETLEAQGVKPFAPPNLHFDKTVDQSKQLNDAHYPTVIISASGMARIRRMASARLATTGMPRGSPPRKSAAISI